MNQFAPILTVSVFLVAVFFNVQVAIVLAVIAAISQVRNEIKYDLEDQSPKTWALRMRSEQSRGTFFAPSHLLGTFVNVVQWIVLVSGSWQLSRLVFAGTSTFVASSMLVFTIYIVYTTVLDWERVLKAVNKPYLAIAHLISDSCWIGIAMGVFAKSGLVALAGIVLWDSLLVTCAMISWWFSFHGSSDCA